MRYNQNADKVITAVKEKMKEWQKDFLPVLNSKHPMTEVH